VAKYHRLLNGEPADPPETHVSHKRVAGLAHKGKRMMDELKTKKKLESWKPPAAIGVSEMDSRGD